MISAYQEARRNFWQASQAAGVEPLSYSARRNVLGPNGEDLAIDVTTIGDPLAPQVVSVTSGVHGVELPFGSSLQCDWIASAHQVCERDASTRFVFVHALNPFGAAYGLRADRQNIDLNRNFFDPSVRPATSDAYRALASAFAPQDIDRLSLCKAWCDMLVFTAGAALSRRSLARGISDFTQALAGGQYEFPDGLYYGGVAPSWSRFMWEKIVPEHIVHPGLQKLWHLDLHTGEGGWGAFSVLASAEDGSPLHERVRALGGDAVRLTTPSFAKLSGDIVDFWPAFALPKSCEVTPFAVEVGTSKGAIEGIDVLHAMLTRNALFVRHRDQHPAARKIIGRMQETFYPSDLPWRVQATANGNALWNRLLAAASSQARP